MENIKAIILSNTTASGLNDTEFLKAQYDLDNPQVLFFDMKTNECLKSFRIAAKSMKQLEQMYHLKYFETPDIEDGKWEKCYGGYFIGVGQIKKAPAATSVLS